jgi:hypothetical protein
MKRFILAALVWVFFVSVFVNTLMSEAAQQPKWPANSTGYLAQACSQPLADVNTSTTVAVNLGHCRGMITGVSAILSAKFQSVI